MRVIVYIYNGMFIFNFLSVEVMNDFAVTTMKERMVNALVRKTKFL